MITSSLQKELAGFAANLELKSLPDSLRWVAKRAVIDTIGVMVLGGTHPEVQTLKRVYASAGGNVSLVGGGRSDWETAALINGMAAHVWDFDDTSYTGIMHASAVIVPALLATADQIDSSSEDIVAAFIAGSEVAYVLAEMAGHGHYFRGWWSTATFGLIGATVGVARLLGRNADVIEAALGLACTAAGGTRKAFGTSAKPYLVGDAARRAIAFGRMAGAGLSGPPNALAGDGAFLDLFSAKVVLSEPVGVRWRLLEPGLLQKRYPVCSAAHAAIDLMIELVETAGVAAGQVESIVAEVPDLVARSLIFDRPRSRQEAQFSLPYALSCALAHGNLDTADLNEAEIRSDAKQRLMEKVRMVAVDDLSTDEMRNRYPESARLIVNLSDGRSISRFCPEAYGMPQRPLSDDDLARKFSACVGGDPFSSSSLRDADLIATTRLLFGKTKRT